MFINAICGTSASYRLPALLTATVCLNTPGIFSRSIFSVHATIRENQNCAQTPCAAVHFEAPETGEVTVISNYVGKCHSREKLPENGQFVSDCENLTAMALRAKYKPEATCHRNMMSRCMAKGVRVHSGLREFRSFLREVGPMPGTGMTLDRINNNDPEYAPGKVRWADKRTQNSNKGDSLTFFNPRTNEVFTTSRLAKLQGVSPSTIRKHLERGWSDEEIIAGKRLNYSSAAPEQPIPNWPVEYQIKRKRHIQQTMARAPGREMTYAERESLWFKNDLERQREEDPDAYEQLLIPHYRLNESAGLSEGDPGACTRKGWLNKFRDRWWPYCKPHVIWEKCEPYHQQAIEEIDPEYARQQRAALARQPELKELL